MNRPKQNVLFILSALLFICLTQAPYLYAAFQSDRSFIFGGFLLNPLDGNTYLSKMRQGWEGKWLFELTYSPEKNQPAFLFVFYLLLGHLCRIFHLDLVFGFHVARFLTSLAMFFAVRNFFYHLFGDRKTVDIALFWAMFGAGLGWLLILFGRFPPDFWIAEGYGFLSAFANPHFPLAIAIMVGVLTLSRNGFDPLHMLWIVFFAGAILANLSPFAWVIASAVLGSLVILPVQRMKAGERRSIFLRLLVLGLGGLPFLVYQLWVVRKDVVLAEWNRQNVTPSPNVAELLFSYLPLAIWAMVGVIRGLRQNDSRVRLPLIWVAISLLLVYLPSALQRRFLIGLYIPLVALAMIAFQSLTIDQDGLRKGHALAFWLRFSIVISVVTNVVLYLATFQAIQQRDRAIFLGREEVAAFRWLSQNMPKDAVILASASSGTFIPAWTGLRVVYGHPFESIHADERKQLIEKFYQGELSLQEQRSFLEENSIAAILLGGRESEIASLEMQNHLEQTYPIGYRSDKVTIYRVRP